MSRMSRIILGLLLAASIMGCNKGGGNTPAGVVKDFLSAKFSDPSNIDKVMTFFSEESLVFAEKNNGATREQIKEALKKQMESNKFNGMSYIDMREVSSKDYDDKIKILTAEIKVKPSKEKEATTAQSDYVLVKENGKYKLSFNDYIKSIPLNNSCGSTKDIQICLDKAVVMGSGVVISGKLTNNSKTTYSYGFAQPTVATLKTDKGETFSSSHPNFELLAAASNQANFLQNSQEMKAIKTGTRDEVFIFGSGTEKVLMTGKPIELTADKIMKTGWGGMPEIGDAGISISVKIK